MEQIEAAVRSVSADGVIARMDKGYDSDVGEGGDLLSTGEKQLLSFARAILADPRIFVLDEATSALDAKTEYEVVKSIKDRGITCIVVAHRLTTVKNCDIIYEIGNGVAVERDKREIFGEE